MFSMKFFALALAGVSLVAATSPASAAFPEGFRWGTAIAGFQVEMGGGPSVIDATSDWFDWTHDAQNRCDPPYALPPVGSCQPKVTKDVPENGPGYYTYYDRDHKRARRLKGDTIRLSIEWSRLFSRAPVGIDPADGLNAAELAELAAASNPAEIAHYRGILLSARKRGLEPMVTLVHFVLPEWIHDPIATRNLMATRGANDPLPAFSAPAGWLDPSIVDKLRVHAAFMGRTFGDLVDMWTPLNEPMVVAVNGFVNVPGFIGGNFPPGVWSFSGAVATIVNEVYANAACYDMLHQYDTVDVDGDGETARVGIVHNLVAFHPANPASAADQQSAQHATYIFNQLFPNAVVRGELDANVDGTIDPGEVVPAVGGKTDFFGANYYLRARASFAGGPLTPLIPLLDFLPALSYAPGACPTVCTDFGWEVYPQGLYEVLALVGQYGLPIYITENGASDADDDLRPYYLVQHLQKVEQAISDGVADVRGYLHWSLVDNFEWSAGFHERFGLYGRAPTDSTTRRKLRRSGRLFAKIAKRNGFDSKLVERYGLGQGPIPNPGPQIP